MPFEQIHGDVFKFKKVLYLTLVEVFSKFTAVKNIQIKSPYEVLNAKLDIMGYAESQKR
jgi:hypothetical protein